MREHCKTQHRFDPDPPLESYKSIGNPRKIGELSKTARARFQSKMTELLRLRELACGHAINESTWDRMKSAESAVNYLLNNYIIIRKSQIQGISGYTCNDCLTFHFRYIKDPGYDLTAEERHHCLVNAVNKANSLENREDRRRQLHFESIRWLVGLSKSVFGMRMEVVIRSISPETFGSTHLHAPLIELDSIDSSHWAWVLIREHHMSLDDERLQKIINKLYGTFGVISINEGEFQGRHLLKVTRQKTLTEPQSK